MPIVVMLDLPPDSASIPLARHTVSVGVVSVTRSVDQRGPPGRTRSPAGQRWLQYCPDGRVRPRGVWLHRGCRVGALDKAPAL